jgi:hypothetical protein
LVFVLPLLGAFYYWQPLTIQSLYDGIVVRIPKESFSARKITQITRRLGSPLWFILAILVSTVQCAYIANVLINTPKFWQNINPLMIAGLLPLRFMGFYAVIFIVVRQAASIILVNRIFREFDVTVAPLHPDRAGGLLSIGHYLITIGLGMALVGFILGLTYLRVEIGIETMSAEFFLDIALYVIAAPILFFLPLWQAHTRLSQVREQILDEIATELQQYYDQALGKLRRGQLTSKEADQLKALDDMRELTEKAPTWPINMGVISRFSAAVALPLLIPIGWQLLTDFLIDLIRK